MAFLLAMGVSTMLQPITSTVSHLPTENLISCRAAYRNRKGDRTLHVTYGAIETEL